MGLNRSSYYYQPAPESPLNLTLMRLIDEQYLRTPFYGYLKMTEYLRQKKEYQVNSKRVYRLMNQMGLRAVAPRPHTSRPHLEHKIYPYLLGGVSITRPNQVWSADITYVPMQRGFMYLVAVLDWHSRYVLSWEVSNTLDGDFCLLARTLLDVYHGRSDVLPRDLLATFFTRQKLPENSEAQAAGYDVERFLALLI